MIKEQFKEKVKDVFSSVAMFLWMLIPVTPVFAVAAFMFLEFTSVWFWVSCIVPLILIIITRPHLGSCSQWENVYWQSILLSIVTFILRIVGFFPM